MVFFTSSGYEVKCDESHRACRDRRRRWTNILFFRIDTSISREHLENARLHFYRGFDRPQRAPRLKGYGITIMHRAERADDHERFKKFCALAQANSLGMVEQVELKEHLEICDSCRKIYEQYAAIVSEGMPFLSASCAVSEEAERWDNREARRKLHTSIQGKKAHIVRA